MIRVAEEARVNISETHSSNNCLSAPITVIEIANGATCDHLKCQVDELSCSHIGLNLVNQKSTSDYHYFSLSSGGNISRSETHLNLDGENAILLFVFNLSWLQGSAYGCYYQVIS